MSKEKQHSKNSRAEKLLPKRIDVWGENTVPFDQPCELGYKCPKCDYQPWKDGEPDERLKWSEYYGFLWCKVCDKDYPVFICMHDPERATDLFLNFIEELQTVTNNNP